MTPGARCIARRKGWKRMWANLWSLAAADGILAGLWASQPAFAQKAGGVLRMPMPTSPASMLIHEESTIAALGPMMGVFNNLARRSRPAVLREFRLRRRAQLHGYCNAEVDQLIDRQSSEPDFGNTVVML